MRKIFVAVVIVDLLISMVVIYDYQTIDKWPVKIKYALFTEITEDKDLFNESPKGMVNVGFKRYFNDLKDDWKMIMRSDIPEFISLEKNIAGMNEVDKAKTIVLKLIKNGSDYCSDINSLRIKLKYLYDGSHGCCTDHSQSFLAYATVFGMNSREVHSVRHVTSEFFVPEKDKWLWIDPLYAIMAKDQNGEYLSLTEIRDRYYEEKIIDYEYFGDNTIYFKDKDPYQYTYYDDKDDFTDLMVTWGNNVFEEDNFNQKLIVLPKSLRQFIGIKLGYIPHYLRLVDHYSDNANIQKYMGRKYNALIYIMVIVNGMFVIYLLMKLIGLFQIKLRKMNKY